MNETLTVDEEVKLLRLADQATKDLEREIKELPRPVVYYCRGREEIHRQKKHFRDCINDWTKRLPGTKNTARQMLLELINRAEYELDEINKVLDAIGAFEKERSNTGN